MNEINEFPESNKRPNYTKWCDLCEHEIVVCGKCGNNMCNGGYGMIDGVECDQCPSAYEEYMK